jgi:hypothetical protein
MVRHAAEGDASEEFVVSGPPRKAVPTKAKLRENPTLKNQWCGMRHPSCVLRARWLQKRRRAAALQKKLRWSRAKVVWCGREAVHRMRAVGAMK